MNKCFVATVGFFESCTKYSIMNNMGDIMSEWSEYKTLLHSLQEDILVTNKDGTIVKVSEATGKVYDVHADELLGRSVYDLEKEGLFTPLATPMVMESQERVTFVQTVPKKKKAACDRFTRF